MAQNVRCVKGKIQDTSNSYTDLVVRQNNKYV